MEDLMILIQGDCLERLKELEPNSVDSLVCDPPAGISFMGKDWDKDKGGRKAWVEWMTEVMRECLRVMKPGAHGLVWAIPRTSHWMAWALEDAGFEVRDVVTHLFGSGFPKSLDVSKQIDKQAGAEREIISTLPAGTGPLKRGHVKSTGGGMSIGTERSPELQVTAPATDDAKEWQGWGTALKPASEHWILVRKPISEKTVAANVLKWGTGAINVDASRVGLDPSVNTIAKQKNFNAMGYGGNNETKGVPTYNAQGRFPANLILSHSDHCLDDQCDIECAVAEMDRQSGESKSTKLNTVQSPRSAHSKGAEKARIRVNEGHTDSGGASRFFYVAKASKREKNAGLEGMEKKNTAIGNASGRGFSESDPYAERLNENHHPTVKSTKLMTYLIRMVTPPGGLVLDCFAGSGTTGVAAVAGGWDFIGIERDPEYFKIAKKRVFSAIPKSKKQTHKGT